MAGAERFGTATGAACFIAMTVSAVAIFSIDPLLLTAMTAEFGWGRGTLSLASLAVAPVMALCHVAVGPALDRFGARRLVLPGFVLFGGATMALSQLSGAVGPFIAMKMLVVACSALITGVSFGKVITRQFTDNRGFMIGLCLGVGGGLGMAIMPQLAAPILAAYGWRATYAAIGCLPILIGVPMALLLPGDRDVHAPVTPQASVPGVAARAALATRPYLLLLGSTLIACAILTGTLAHTAAIITDAGLSTRTAALGLSLFAGSMMCGQFGIGLLLDRIGSPRLAIPVFVIVLIGLLLFHVGRGPAALLGGAVLVGAGAGSEYGLLPYMLTRFFGLRAFGTLYGLLYAVSAIGSGIGPYLMGLTFDLADSYGLALLAFEVGTLLVMALVAWLPAYRFAADGRPVDPVPGIG